MIALVCGSGQRRRSTSMARGLLPEHVKFRASRNDPPQTWSTVRIGGNYRSDTREVFLNTMGWINQGPGAFICHLRGQLDPSGTRITGSSPGCTCGNFELVRQ